MTNDSFAFLQKDLAPNELNAQINLDLVPILKRHQRQSGNITSRYEVDDELKCTVVTNEEMALATTIQTPLQFLQA
jgi:hypothetical protein